MVIAISEYFPNSFRFLKFLKSQQKTAIVSSTGSLNYVLASTVWKILFSILFKLADCASRGMQQS